LGPEAPATQEEGTADIRVVLGRGESVPAQKRLTWDGCCRVSLLAGGVVVVEPAGNATARDLALAASGSGLALALAQRSLLVLHGSCVAIDGEAICLLGQSGVGKSTLAAALQAAGHVLVSDAMTAIRVGESAVPHAVPGWPVLKLWPNTVNHLGLERQTMATVHPQSEKLLCSPGGVCAAAPVPVRWFVSVMPDDPAGLIRLSPAAGVMTLLRNLYLIDDTSPAEHAALLTSAAWAVARAGTALLRRGSTLAQLSEVVASLEGLVRSAPEH
jgi:hypothetical protein